ncbi:hypothetical protein [Streptosporangium carneum]|uniref:Uncharacterized protein n=1 Tax=Streptosporangium carneum TaxID=47481 RepID=A0A9W6MAG5_9ACTN|nr:hypothetical protein [Streptosporangium carneum]GLK06987.1 hypothetical protein GCM10017600_03920 [Streptosporangium carneum]
MNGRGFSQSAWDRGYRAVVARAFATVPYYREMWAEAGARLDEPVVTSASRLDSLLERLYPLGAPYERRREAPAWAGEPAELFEALELTGSHRRDRPLFEVREALLDWDRIGPGGARYHVVLSAAAEVADPELRSAGLRALRAAHEPGLLGDAAQIAELDDRPDRARIFLRRSPAALGTPGAPPEDPDGPSRGAEVLHDVRLGYLGARHRGCGRAHVNWRRVHTRQGQAGPLFTMLRRHRPTLANISLPGTDHLTVDRCGEHGTPILTADGVRP